jgi:hypothetical protein
VTTLQMAVTHREGWVVETDDIGLPPRRNKSSPLVASTVRSLRVGDKTSADHMTNMGSAPRGCVAFGESGGPDAELRRELLWETGSEKTDIRLYPKTTLGVTARMSEETSTLKRAAIGPPVRETCIE